MGVVLTIAGQTFNYPTTSDDGWGSEASDWAVAVSTELLQRSGGTFTLTNDVNFGANFATIQQYLKSRSSNIATAGFIRMAVGDSIQFRNNANNGNIVLAVNGSDEVTINGTPVLLSPGGILAVADGGTGLGVYAAGDLIYASATTTLARLAKGTALQFLQMNSGATAPEWASVLGPAQGGTGVANNSAATLTRSGNHALTITTTNTTSVTLPTAGTLATLAGTETFTNKTLTSPAITTPTISTGLLNGVQLAVAASQTSGFTATITGVVYPCDATSAGFTVTLPSAASNAGQAFWFKKTDASSNAVTIGAITTLYTQGECVGIVSDGSTYQVITRDIPLTSEVVVDTTNGYGAVNTVIPRFTNTQISTGADIVYADSANAGASLTVKSPGVYSIAFVMNFAAGNRDMGLSVNSAQLTTAIGSITQANRLVMTRSESQTNSSGSVSVTRRFALNDVIRPHTDGGTQGTGTAEAKLSIVRVS